MQVLYLSDASLIRFHAELENKESAMEPACFASARSSGEMCLAFRFLSLNPEHGFKFCLGGSLTHSTGLHQTWFSSQWWWMKSLKLPRQFIHDLLTSSLQVVFIKQSIDTGTINSSVNCGQTEVPHFLHTHKHTHTYTLTHSGWCETVSWRATGELDSYTDLCSFTLGSWWMMFVWFSWPVVMTHTNTQSHNPTHILKYLILIHQLLVYVRFKYFQRFQTFTSFFLPHFYVNFWSEQLSNISTTNLHSYPFTGTGIYHRQE